MHETLALHEGRQYLQSFCDEKTLWTLAPVVGARTLEHIVTESAQN